MKRLLTILLIAALSLALCACKPKEKPIQDVPNPIATITMTDGRVMRFELHLEAAPNTVANFVVLANRGFYDRQQFFRTVSGVLIQAGDPNNDGTGNAGYVIKGEFTENGFENPLSHLRGTLSMARQSDYDTASSQFFILQGNYPDYDGKYAAFGTAVDEETLSTIDYIASQPADANYLPLLRQKIKSIRVDTFGQTYKPETIKLPEPTKK